MGETDARLREDLTKTPIRDAATLILVRDPENDPRVLMGQRGAGAAFMANKFVFPGGAVDPEDANTSVQLSEKCRARLSVESNCIPSTLAQTALRELREETGQTLAPAASELAFFFRAITPQGRPRRFDARFFLADAAALTSDPDRFEPLEAELSHIQWVSLQKAMGLDLPFVTRLVLAELADHLPATSAPAKVPFLRNDSLHRAVSWL